MNDTLPDILKREAISKLIETARLLIDDKLDLVEGSRLIIQFARKGDILDDDIFLPIMGFEDQTQHFLIGEARRQAEEKYLNNLDKEKDEFIKEIKPEIIEDCKQIINKYSKQTMNLT